MGIVSVQASAEDYEWDNVRIGGGGYAIGAVIHPLDSDLFYVRTDVGGAYRYDKAQGRLIQLITFPSPEDYNLYGCWGLDVDPNDPNIVYVALGKYPDRVSGVYKSTDQGRTWTSLGLSKPFGSNRHPDRYSKPLVVNPADPRYVWCGTYGEGLYLYDNQTEQWSKVSGIPDGKTVQRVLHDPANPSQVYVGLHEGGVYRSDNGGASFSFIPGSTSEIWDIDISADGAHLYVAAGDTLRRLDNPATGSTWKAINTPAGGTYRTVTADPLEAGKVITAKGEYGSIMHIYVSANAGDSWVQKGYNVDQHIPWHPGSYPGSAISQFAIDPQNTRHVIFTDWYSVWETWDIDASTVTWSNERAYGHEELVNLVMACPEENGEGVFLYSGHADVGGLRHTSLTEFPTVTFRSSMGSAQFVEGTGIGVTPADPLQVYVSGATSWGGETGVFASSSDTGRNFSVRSGYSSSWGWSRLAVSATDPQNVVAATRSSGIKYSRNGGVSWSSASGAPSGSVSGGIFSYMHPLAADGVNGNTFYLYHNSDSSVYRSTNGGASWTKRAGNLSQSGSDSRRKLASAPGHEGHLWLTRGGNGLSRSEDGGGTWVRVSGITAAYLLAIGKEAPGAGYPAIYFFGRMTGDSSSWIYRSIDEGTTWERINDPANRIGNSPQTMEADRQTFGIVYVGTNGTGIFFGRPAGPPDEDPPAAPEGLEAEAISDARVLLNWQPNTEPDLRDYKLYRGSGGDPVFLQDGIHATEYTDRTVEPSTTYTYHVTAVDRANNESPFSVAAGVTTPAEDTDPPAAPTGLTAELENGRHVALSWEENIEPDLEGYHLYRSDVLPVNADPANRLGGLLTGTTYLDQGLEEGQTVHYAVTALDLSDNESAPSASVSVTTELTLDALFVVGSTSLNIGDQAVRARLLQLGFHVNTVDDGDASSADLEGVELILVSSTSQSGTVGSAFRNVSVPCIVWEAWLYDDMGMTGSDDSNFDDVEGQTQLTIRDGSHPLAAGYSGDVTVVSSPQRFMWGIPGSSAAKVASIRGSTTQMAIFGYESGTVMPGRTAPARRVGFHLHDTTAGAWSEAGEDLFDAAVFWASGISGEPTATEIIEAICGRRVAWNCHDTNSDSCVDTGDVIAVKAAP